MNKGQFISLLNNPHEIDKVFIPELQNVVKDYPYFQSAQLLLTKAFHSSENLNFEGSLKKSAAYASDRKQLHALLFSKVITEPLEKSNTEEFLTIETKDEVIHSNPISKEVDRVEIIESDNALSDSTPLSEELNTSAISSIQDVVSEEIFDLSRFEVKEAEKENLLIDKLEQQIISSAINSSILLEVSNEIPELNDLSSTIETRKPDSFVHQTPTKKNSEAERSFSDWIKYFGDELEETEETEEITENTLYIRSSQEKKEFYSASKMAKLSVQEDDDLVTETLANIYADQGSFEKAIKAFKKLQLKYPEKSVYFAGRIKEIQNQINS